MAKHGNLRISLEYLAVRLLLGALRLMPPRLAMATGRMMGIIARLLARDLTCTAERNLKIAFPEKTEEERRRLVRGCFDSLGRQLGLFSQFRTASRESLRSLADVEGWENLETARNNGRKVIFFTAHLGAWEYSSFNLSLYGYQLNFLVRRLDNPKVEQFIDQIRTRFGNISVDKRGAARPMLTILKNHGILGLLVDLNTLDDEAIFVDFFGVPAATTYMLAKLALRTDAVILPGFAPWDQTRGKYVVYYLPPIQFERSGQEEEDIRRITAQISGIVEEYVRRYPEQWLWIHKRWKTRPAGEPDLYV